MLSLLDSAACLKEHIAGTRPKERQLGVHSRAGLLGFAIPDCCCASVTDPHNEPVCRSAQHLHEELRGHTLCRHLEQSRPQANGLCSECSSAPCKESSYTTLMLCLMPASTIQACRSAWLLLRAEPAAATTATVTTARRQHADCAAALHCSMQP